MAKKHLNYLTVLLYVRVGIVSNVSSGQLSLHDETFFRPRLFHLLTFGDITVGGYTNINNSQFAVFDSHGRNSKGFQDENGAAV